MNKTVIFVMIVIIAASVALIAYSQSLQRANVFNIEVNNYAGEYYYSVWYTGLQTLTDVHVLLNGGLVRQYNVFAPSQAEPVARWMSPYNNGATVEIQWNDGRQVLNYQP